jgi:hypothetical protein
LILIKGINMSEIKYGFQLPTEPIPEPTIEPIPQPELIRFEFPTEPQVPDGEGSFPSSYKGNGGVFWHYKKGAISNRTIPKPFT